MGYIDPSGATTPSAITAATQRGSVPAPAGGPPDPTAATSTAAPAPAAAQTAAGSQAAGGATTTWCPVVGDGGPAPQAATAGASAGADVVAGGPVSGGGPRKEQGATAVTPWSGYWWPQRPGNDLNMYDRDQALALYDRYVMKTRGYNPGAQAWEKRNHARHEGWAGHCQAWAAASLLTREPPASVTRAGVRFDNDALEGLVSEIYYEPTYQWLAGNRAETNDPNDPNFKDMDPGWLDYLARTMIGSQERGFVMDIDPGVEVWNFPAFAYKRDATPKAGGGEHVKMTIWYGNGDANVHGEPTYFSRTYEYDLTRQGDRQTGRWTGASVKDHPDFAWLPTGKTAQSGASGGDPRNPHVDEAIVEEILGYGI